MCGGRVSFECVSVAMDGAECTVKMQVQHNVRAGARAGVDTLRRNNGYFLA